MLSSTGILAAMEDKRIGISNFDLERLGTNSYDLLLGNWFYEVQWTDNTPVFIGPQWFDDGERVHVPNGGTLLAMTKDVIDTNYDIVGELKARSSIGRVGITVCRDAGLGDVGYCNHWTLEITGYVICGTPFLIVGEAVAQVVFHQLDTPPIKSYSGQYVSSEWPKCIIPKKYR